ncbi:D-alanyl-D-alanine carboxypeptidase [Candidatus Parcubacteria bacterium]|nr:D-alanyl-D-alanine carboxypeptidase [Candidatus Parcubacteria bacterium]
MGIYNIEHGYRKNKRWSHIIYAALLLAVGIYLVGNIYGNSQQQAQTAAAQLMSQPSSVPPAGGQPAKITAPLPWPDYGQAAYGAVDEGVLAQSTEKTEPVPIASLAKLITALAVLKQKPLAPGEQGPAITLSEEDVTLYREYVAKSGTVVPVQAGGQITQYQALQATLLRSANNMSDTLVRWAFGSMEEYNTYANEMLDELGLTDTIVADASGYSPLTKSTASDMVNIGLLYMQNPLLREIALQPEATIPFAGVVTNYNALINQDGVTGLKVGYTDEARNTFLVADIRGVNQDEISVAAVLGAHSMPTAMKDAKRLLKTGNAGHKLLTKKQP